MNFVPSVETKLKENRFRTSMRSAMEDRLIPRWYLLLDGLALTFSSIGVLVSIVFLLSVITCRQKRQSAACLIACNTQLAIFILSATTVHSMAIVLNNDLHHLNTFDSLCIWRSYFVYSEFAGIYYSFVIQSYYRYMRVIHSRQFRYSSVTTICIMMIVQWIVIHGIMLLLPLGGSIEFNIDSQMCSVVLTRYSVIWITTVLIYSPPYNIISFVYLRLAMYSKKSRLRVTSLTLNNARRELEVIKRMLLVIFIFSVSGVPYTVFAILALLNRTVLPVYYNRIITCFNAMGLAIASNIILLQDTNVRQTIVKFIRKKNNRRVHPHPPPIFRL